MKYFLIITVIISILGATSYLYVNNKFINEQEKGFKLLASANFKESPRIFPDSTKMPEEIFWQLIEESKLKNKSNFKAQVRYLAIRLSKLDNEEIVGFEKTFREEIIRSWDYNVKSLYQIIHGDYLSADGFLYFRCYLLSNGKDFYRSAANNPDKLAYKIEDNYDGELMLYVADEAFELKNGKATKLARPRDKAIDISYDFGKYRMTGEYVGLEDFEDRYPNLTKKF